MTRNLLDSAFATLGVRHDASPVVVKRRYRQLVKKWHPDQFAADPQGVTEATLMLKAINRAYATILRHRSPDAHARETVANPASPVRPGRSFDARLTQSQIDDIVAAIHDSESLLAAQSHSLFVGWHSRVASLALALVCGVEARQPGDAGSALVACLLPLMCIWFPDVLGDRVSGRITKSSPPLLVWLLGWALLLLLVIVGGIDRLWTP